MAKPFRKMEVLLGDAVYVLGRSASETLIEMMDAYEGEVAEVLRELRVDLAKALDAETEGAAPVNPFETDTEEDPDAKSDAENILKTVAVIKSVAKENEDECGDCRIPRCRFCDQPGTRAGGRKDGAGRTVERYYVCKTAGCIAAKMATPQPMGLFAGGAS
jgi:hypothetical protein